jgi:hypothetical protein
MAVVIYHCVKLKVYHDLNKFYRSIAIFITSNGFNKNHIPSPSQLEICELKQTKPTLLMHTSQTYQVS